MTGRGSHRLEASEHRERHGGAPRPLQPRGRLCGVQPTAGTVAGGSGHRCVLLLLAWAACAQVLLCTELWMGVGFGFHVRVCLCVLFIALCGCVRLLGACGACMCAHCRPPPCTLAHARTLGVVGALLRFLVAGAGVRRPVGVRPAPQRPVDVRGDGPRRPGRVVRAEPGCVCMCVTRCPPPRRLLPIVCRCLPLLLLGALVLGEPVCFGAVVGVPSLAMPPPLHPCPPARVCCTRALACVYRHYTPWDSKVVGWAVFVPVLKVPTTSSGVSVRVFAEGMGGGVVRDLGQRSTSSAMPPPFAVLLRVRAQWA
jgi:hypothetical protein